MLQITQSTSPKEISKLISKLREQKGKEKETLRVISEALNHGHDFVVNLFWEEALTYQHLIMNKDSKGDNSNKEIRSKNLLKMKNAVTKAKYYIVRFDLNMWKHRMYRFLGRVDDYSMKYDSAINNYKRSIRYAKKDPDFIEMKIPRYLEVAGFLSYSTIMSGDLNKGYNLALKTYDKFNTDKFALELKKKDYVTWAIWRTGIVIRTTTALIHKKSVTGIGNLKDWLREAEKLLVPKKDFGYRLGEIKELKKKLLLN